MHGSCEIWDTLCPVSLYLMHNITGVDYKTNDGFSVQIVGPMTLRVWFISVVLNHYKLTYKV